MSDAYRAGKYHAETNQRSNLDFYTPHTFAWFDYLEGQATGFNEQVWYHTRCSKDEDCVKLFESKLAEVKAKLKAAGR